MVDVLIHARTWPLGLGFTLGLLLQSVSLAQSILVPKDTPVRIVLSGSVSSANSRPGQAVELEVSDDVFIEDAGEHLVVVRRGARAWGTIGEDTKPAASLSRPGKFELRLLRIVSVTGDTIPVVGKQSAQGESGCFAEGCAFVWLVPWLKGGDVVLRPSTKFYVSVREGVFLDRAQVQKYQQPIRQAVLEGSLLTIFRCEEIPGIGSGNVSIAIDRQWLVDLSENRFLTVHLPGGSHIVAQRRIPRFLPLRRGKTGAVSKEAVPVDGTVNSRYYIRVSDRDKRRLWLEPNDDCHDLSAVLAPEDWHNISEEWQLRQ